MVGRTPWSAAGPLAGFLKIGSGLLRENSGSRGTRADQGVRPTEWSRGVTGQKRPLRVREVRMNAQAPASFAILTPDS